MSEPKIEPGEESRFHSSGDTRQKLPPAPVTTGGKCPTCDGRGFEIGDETLYRYPCPDCHGTGQKAQPESEVKSCKVSAPAQIISTNSAPSMEQQPCASNAAPTSNPESAAMTPLEISEFYVGSHHPNERSKIPQIILNYEDYMTIVNELRKVSQQQVSSDDAANLSSETIRGHKVIDSSPEFIAEVEATRKTPEYAKEIANVSSEDECICVTLPLGNRPRSIFCPKHGPASEDAGEAWIEWKVKTNNPHSMHREIFLAGRASQQQAIAALTAEVERWKEDSMRQAATINRLAAAAEDRNEVDKNREKMHAEDLANLRHELDDERRISKATDELARSLSEGGKMLRQELAAKEAACHAMRAALEAVGFYYQNAGFLHSRECLGGSRCECGAFEARYKMDDIEHTMSTSVWKGWRSPEEWERRTRVLKDVMASLELQGIFNESLAAARKELEDNQ